MDSSLLESVRMLTGKHLTTLQLPDLVIAVLKIAMFCVLPALRVGWAQ